MGGNLTITLFFNTKTIYSFFIRELICAPQVFVSTPHL